LLASLAAAIVDDAPQQNADECVKRVQLFETTLIKACGVSPMEFSAGLSWKKPASVQ
jgi:hypothetical protein